MCDIIELHELDGSEIGFRQDVIMIVRKSEPEENPLGGSVIYTDLGRIQVLETPSEILPMLRVTIVAVAEE